MNLLNKKPLLVGFGICLLGAMFYFYEYLLRMEPSVMVNELMRQFNVTAASFGAMTAMYYYAYTPMQLLVGVLIDKYGSRVIFSLAIITCAAGSFLFTISNTVAVGGVARFLIGFGSSFAFVGVLKLAAEWLPSKYFASFAGFTTSLGMFAGMFGDIGLTSLVEAIGWRNTQHLGTAFGIVLIPLILIFVHDTPDAFRGVAIKGKKTFKQSFASLHKIMRNPQMWLVGVVGSVLYLSLSAFAELWGIKFLQTVYNLEPERAAVACSMVFIGWLVGGPFTGFLSDHLKSRKIPIFVGGMLSACMIGIIILKPFNMTFAMLSSCLFLFGAFSSAEVVCFAVSKESNSHDLAATSVAFTNFVVMLSGIIFQPLLGILLDYGWSGQLSNGVRTYVAHDYQVAFLAIPVCIILGTFLTIWVKETLGKK